MFVCLDFWGLGLRILEFRVQGLGCNPVGKEYSLQLLGLTASGAVVVAVGGTVSNTDSH